MDEDQLPVRFKILTHESLVDFAGFIAGAAQPGYYWNSSYEDQTVLQKLQEGSSIKEAGVDPWMSEELAALDSKAVDVIYSLGSEKTERYPPLLKWIWENIYHKTFITSINNIPTEVDDYHSPTEEQIESIISDIITRIANKQNVLITCGAGLGRTGTVLASLMIKLDEFYAVSESVEVIHQNYNSSAIEGEKQYNCLNQFSIKLKQNYISKSYKDIVLDKALLFALELDDINRASKFIDLGAKLHKKVALDDKILESFFSYIIKTNRKADIGLLLEHNINFNFQYQGVTPLIILIESKDLDLISKFLEIPNIDLELESPIKHALYSKHLVRMLMFKGASLSELPENFFSATELKDIFMESHNSGNLKLLRNLLATPPLRNKIEFDIETQNISNEASIVLLAAEFIDEDSFINKAKTILKVNDFELFSHLILNYVDLSKFDITINFSKENIEFILKEAVKISSARAIINLAKLYKELKLFEINSMKLVDYSISQNRVDLAIALAREGFATNISNVHTPPGIDNALLVVVKFNRYFQIEELLEQGANPNIYFEDGSTLLSFVIKNKQDKILDILLKHNIDINLKDSVGKTAIFYAIDYNSSVLQTMIEKGAELNIIDNNNVSPLFYAISNGVPGTIEVLLRGGADINFINNNLSALMFAAKIGKPSIIKLLIKYGAEVNFTNSLGENAFVLCYVNSSKISLRILRILLENNVLIEKKLLEDLRAQYPNFYKEELLREYRVIPL